MLGEPAPMQVEPGEAEATLRVTSGYPHEPIVDPQGLRIGGHPTRHHRRDRTQDQLAEHHEMNYAPQENLRTLSECLGQ